MEHKSFSNQYQENVPDTSVNIVHENINTESTSKNLETTVEKESTEISMDNIANTTSANKAKQTVNAENIHDNDNEANQSARDMARLDHTADSDQSEPQINTENITNHTPNTTNKHKEDWDRLMFNSDDSV